MRSVHSGVTTVEPGPSPLDAASRRNRTPQIARRTVVAFLGFLCAVLIPGCKDKSSSLPAIAVSSPTNLYKSTATKLDAGGVALECSGASEVSWLNATNGAHGVAQFAEGRTNWSATGIGLAPGTNAILFTATNAAGSSGPVQLLVIYDPPLKLAITDPAGSGFTASSNSITIAGTVESNGASRTISWFNNRGGSS